MTSSSAAFQRARSPAHKEVRNSAILHAARTIGLRDGVRHVTLTDIASAVGLHKSAVLRYCETREDVFLHLTADEWQSWATAVGQGAAIQFDSGAVALATILINTLGERPLFCDLLAHAPLNLERHVSAASVRRYKVTALHAVADLATHAQTRVPALTDAQAWELIVGTTSLAGALWQISHPPPALAELYSREPALGHGATDFEPKLTTLVTALVRGLSR